MKRKWLIVCCSGWFLAPIVALAFQNEPDGFRGVKWGTGIKDNAAEMTLMHEKNNKGLYLRKGDQLSIGGAELKEIVYIYWKEKLQSVGLKSIGVSNKSALIEAFHAQFGKPEKPNRFIDEYFWRGAVTTISLECKSIGDVCRAFLFSSELSAQERQERKEAAAGAKKDF